jgi:hypothetical protein
MAWNGLEVLQPLFGAAASVCSRFSVQPLGAAASVCSRFGVQPLGAAAFRCNNQFSLRFVEKSAPDRNELALLHRERAGGSSKLAVTAPPAAPSAVQSGRSPPFSRLYVSRWGNRTVARG